MGPVMLDLVGVTLTEEEKEILDHPLVGGVILFTRNYESREQIQKLIADIRQSSRNQILIAVDHEGGRVQRFRHGFTHIPAMGDIYPYCDGNIEKAAQLSEKMGWLMASEALAVGIDISFAPVLDVWGISEVIGDRSFHASPDIIVPMAAGFIKGMRRAGMKVTGKHFPGHGSVKEDSHIAIPVDGREKERIFNHDMKVFGQLIEQQLIDAIMPAHVIYPSIDSKPAGFSKRWINGILRTDLNFDGVVFSDDLAMKGATTIGSFEDRATAALNAGCDMVLVCNDRNGAIEVLDRLDADHFVENGVKLTELAGRLALNFDDLSQSELWQEAVALAGDIANTEKVVSTNS
ncbi:beta-N-acetylhexosaminidase [Flocculibacter collagenilyticus]|uniref:beta-N-acetylhexosaminidase n=1 Tax=Flocculibacter collagenilyticus TaxID=2744479 RepID=UPI001F473632|nr:beta-N-acetylhexosaminidase [Flocculibacter collagenilyticus]